MFTLKDGDADYKEVLSQFLCQRATNCSRMLNSQVAATVKAAKPHKTAASMTYIARAGIAGLASAFTGLVPHEEDVSL